MAAKRPHAAANDSSDSDDSMDGKRPKRSLPEVLLRSSNRFMKLYEEYQPNIQQIITQLFRSTVVEINRTIREAQGGLGGFTARVLRVGQNLSAEDVLLGPSISSASFTAAGSGGEPVHRNREELLKEAERAVETFRTTAGNINVHLRNVCDSVEKILEYQRDEESASLRCDVEKLRKHEVLPEHAEMFKREDLENFLEQARRTLRNEETLDFLLAALLNFFRLISGLVSENYRVLRDFDRLKDQSSVQESDMGTSAGRFVCKMRETLNQLLNVLNELRSSKTGVENVLIPNLNRYFEKRRTYSKDQPTAEQEDF